METNLQPDPAELSNAEIEPVCRKYLELRYRLLPYNYTLLREACDTGLSPMRALWLHYPGDPEAVKRGDEYLWGRDLLVAPVTTKGAVERKLYLPQDDWYDFRPAERFRQLQPVLEKRGIDLTYIDKVESLDPKVLGAYDGLGIYANTTRTTPEQEKALLDFVEGGKGFIPLHCVVSLHQVGEICRAGWRSVQEPRHRHFPHDHWAVGKEPVAAPGDQAQKPFPVPGMTPPRKDVKPLALTVETLE